MSNQFTLSLDSSSSNPSTTGGKGHNLAVLSRDGNLPVPPGFVVTVAAYRDFVNGDEGLLKEIEGALSQIDPKDDGAGGDASTADLEKISDAVRGAFRRRTVSEALAGEISVRLTDTFPASSSSSSGTTTYLAVRSSGTCEDMPDASFAGQHDTYLNVHPNASNVCRHVVDCFSSLFTGRAIAYRRRNGISHVDAGMAVVVQGMVRSKSSGVLFTANPLTGRRNESVLEAIPGLGEALVSGSTEPDRYVVSRRRRRTAEDGTTAAAAADLDIRDARVGAKVRSIRPAEGGGVREEISPAASASPVLNEDEVKRVVEIGQEVEALFENKPQDIEWASDGKTFFVVQSRPITTLFPLPNVPAEPLQVFFSFNAVQGIVAPIFPSGQDALAKGLLGGLLRTATWGRFGHTGEFMQRAGERLYANVTIPLRNSVGREMVTNFLTAVEPGILAGIEELLDSPGMTIDGGMNPRLFFRLCFVAAISLPRFVLSVMFPDWSRRRVVARANDLVARIERRAAEGAERDDDLSDAIEFKREALSSFPAVLIHFVPRMAASMGPLFLLKKLASSVPDGNDLALTITRGLPHNVTTEMDLKLWGAAEEIRRDPESLRRFRSDDADAGALAGDYLRGGLPVRAQRAIRAFMDEYGMRGLYEIDFGRPRWREEPAPLMNALKSYVEIKEEERAPDRVFRAGEVAAMEAAERLGKELGRPRLVSFLARRVRSIAGIRELPKFTMIRVLGILRVRMLREGEKLADAGIIDDPRDLFLLYDDELKSLAGGGELEDCKKLVRERKAAMAREGERTRIPRVIASDGFAFYGGAPSDGGGRADAKEGADAPLRGEPVSPGTYIGRIRVVRDPSETRLNHGEILCCHGTDPSWTPLFLSSGALVMEVGGLMTHGSVVAREYGIPAVVGLEKVTERLTTGQLVRVDGSSGVVEVIDDLDEKETQNLIQ